MTKYDLDPLKGGGAHMWRGEWNPTVSQIHRDLLSESRIPRIDVPDSQHFFLCRIRGACLWQGTEAG